MAGDGSVNDRQPRGCCGRFFVARVKKGVGGTLWKFHIYTSCLRYNRQ